MHNPTWPQAPFSGHVFRARIIFTLRQRRGAFGIRHDGVDLDQGLHRQSGGTDDPARGNAAGEEAGIHLIDGIDIFNVAEEVFTLTTSAMT